MLNQKGAFIHDSLPNLIYPHHRLNTLANSFIDM